MSLFTQVIFSVAIKTKETLYQVTENELIKCSSHHTEPDCFPASNSWKQYFAITTNVQLPQIYCYGISAQGTDL